MNNIPKKFIIDYNVWRCGGENPVKGFGTGEGKTRLLNEEGSMCCLGQIASQCGADWDTLKSVVSPASLTGEVLIQLQGFLLIFRERYLDNSEFSNYAMRINDNPFTRIKTKIIRLTELFKSEGYELEFINVPEEYLV